MNWSTESEINSKSFTVQRSFNAANFVDVATIMQQELQLQKGTIALLI
jgi:hypothetical protein